MPSRNVVKTYVENGFYHVYNRGVEKRIIFKETQDYKVFLSYLKEYLSPQYDNFKLKKEFTLQGETFKGVPRQPKNYYGKIDLISYCLMPNHFHFLLKQVSNNQMQEFVRSISTRYSMYFNKKYNRIGSLYQGPYKAVLISHDTFLLHLSRYIHLNPSEFSIDLTNTYSSYAEFLGLRNTLWIKQDIILNLFNNMVTKDFKKINNYKDFVEKAKINDKEIVGDLILED